MDVNTDEDSLAEKICDASLTVEARQSDFYQMTADVVRNAQRLGIIILAQGAPLHVDCQAVSVYV
jgi:hypothetical protein